MRKLQSKVMLLSILAFGIFISSCKKDKDDNKNPDPSNPGSNRVLVVKSSGISMEVGGTFQLNAVWVDNNGNETAATGVSWSSSAASVASVSSTGLVKGESPGAAFIVAQITQSGITSTSRVPVSITARPQQGGQGPGSGLLPFVAAPAAVVWWAEDPNKDLQIVWVYFGAGSLSAPTFSSSNTAVVTVSSTGLMTFRGAGEAIITVNATAGGTTYTQQIPVLVVGTPPVPLPVTRIEIEPKIKKLFIDGEHTFTAKAYNSQNQEVTDIAFAWEIEDADPDTIDGVIIKGATVDQNGKVKGVRPSVIKVKASAKGVSGSATLMIYPDGFYTVTPFNQFVSAGQTVNLTGAYFEFNKTTFEAEPKAWPVGTEWKTLSQLLGGFPGLPQIGTLTAGSSNSATFRVNALDPFNPLIPGTFELIFVGQLQTTRIEPGVSVMTVGF
jgi:hypothetical protein